MKAPNSRIKVDINRGHDTTKRPQDCDVGSPGPLAPVMSHSRSGAKVWQRDLTALVMTACRTQIDSGAR
jgi:hypothetical protein